MCSIAWARKDFLFMPVGFKKVAGGITKRLRPRSGSAESIPE